MNLPQGLAEYLEAEGVLDYRETAGGNTFIDDLPAATQKSGAQVAFYHTGGVEADSGLAYDSPALQVVVRGTLDPRVAIDLWYSIYSHLHGLANVTLPNGDYLVSCLAVQSAPVRIGPDENGRHRYSMNLRCEVKNSTEHRS